MKYLEFDSLYKFVISVGIIFIVSPFFIYYLLFNKSISLLITATEFDKLTSTSQKIITIKQNLFLRIINSNWYYVLIVLFIIVGMSLIGFGIYGWWKTQKNIDEKNFLENKKLRMEIEISETERQIKVEKEIANDEKILKNKKKSTVYEYMRIEKQLFKRINQKMGDMYQVVQNARIGDSVYDIIAISNYLLKKDYIFEVKYIKENINRQWINKVFEQIDRQTSNYSANTNRMPYRILIIVTENENYSLVNDEISLISKKNNFQSIVVPKNKINYLDWD